MYSTIKARVADQTLTITSAPKLASGGENEIRVEVGFDAYWDGLGKTAIFYRKENHVYHVVMVNDVCVIPREVMAEAGRLYFGVIGTAGSSVRTTEVVALKVEQGAITGLGNLEPLPDVYKQVLEAYENAERSIVAETSARKQEVAVERARIDNLIANGGTSDDAELVDIRVGADGKTYPTAGKAIRSLYAPSVARVIDATNYATLLPDVGITQVSIYKLLFEKGSTDIPSGLPFSEWEGGIATLLTTNTQTEELAHYVTQFLITTENIYYRYSSTVFLPWVNLSDKLVEKVKAETTPSASANTLTVTNGGSILSALKSCYANGYNRLIVEAGEYDVIAEYEAYYGSSYFTDYTGYAGQADEFTRGLWLEDIEVVFNPGAKVICKYTGDNDAVVYNFCAFATGNNVTIDGLHLDAENLRYGIHADFNTGMDVTTFKVRNCDLRHYRNTVNCQAIGAGLGAHVLWEIENTVFRSDYATIVFRIHNNINAAAQSKVIIRNCYIAGPGFFRFNHYSESEALTDVLVSGCSYYNEPVVGMEIEGATTPENMRLIAWNNEKRV